MTDKVFVNNDGEFTEYTRQEFDDGSLEIDNPDPYSCSCGADGHGETVDKEIIYCKCFCHGSESVSLALRHEESK